MNRSKRQMKNTVDPTSFLIIVIFAVLVIGGISGYLANETDMGDREMAPPYLTASQAAHGLPNTVEPATFSDASTSAAYRAAREIPEVLAQQPCYCRCHRMGHRSLLDCFASTHASDCDICLKEALFALQEHHQGKTARQIRDGINRGTWQSVQL